MDIFWFFLFWFLVLITPFLSLAPLLLCCCQATHQALPALPAPRVHCPSRFIPGRSLSDFGWKGKTKTRDSTDDGAAICAFFFFFFPFLFSRAEPPTPPLVVRSRNSLSLSPRSVRRARYWFLLPSYLPTWVSLLGLTTANNSHRLCSLRLRFNMRRAGGLGGLLFLLH